MSIMLRVARVAAAQRCGAASPPTRALRWLDGARSRPRTRTSPARRRRAGRAPNRATCCSSASSSATSRSPARETHLRHCLAMAVDSDVTERGIEPRGERLRWLRRARVEPLRDRHAPARVPATSAGASCERVADARRVGNSRLRHVRLAAAAPAGDRRDVAHDRVRAHAALAEVVRHDGEQRALAVVQSRARTPTPLRSCSRSASPSAWSDFASRHRHLANDEPRAIAAERLRRCEQLSASSSPPPRIASSSFFSSARRSSSSCWTRLLDAVHRRLHQSPRRACNDPLALAQVRVRARAR